jgi:RimJ/RimL family protein N-acetyltransferase
MLKTILKDYPKEFTLKDKKTKVVVRPMEASDRNGLLKFFRSLSEKDRLYLRHDVTLEETIDKWVKNINYERVFPLLALHEKAIVADATLHRNEYSWTRHVGEIRIVVGEAYRRKGLGFLLLKEIFYVALRMGLHKLVAETAEDDLSAVRMLEKMGFQKEAVLKNHIMDPRSVKHNLLIMSNDVETLLRHMADLEKELFPSRTMEE